MSSNISKALGRTEHIKHTTYWGDGMGRDSYVITGNGGLVGDANMPKTSAWTGYQPTNNTTKMFINQNHQFKKSTGGKDAVAFRYFGDGSGRDSYVVADSGGLVPKYVNKGVLNNFYNSLRQPDNSSSKANSSINRRTILQAVTPTTPQPGMPFNDPTSGMWYKEPIRTAIRNCYISQRQQAKRLANPKSTRAKFGEYSNLSSGRKGGMQSVKSNTNRKSTHSALIVDLEKSALSKGRRNIPNYGRNSLICKESQRNSLLDLRSSSNNKQEAAKIQIDKQL